MEVKKNSLSNYFGIYSVKICMIPVMIAAVILIAFSLAVSSKSLRLANYEEMQISEAARTIEQADTITSDLIPEMVEYVILKKDGTKIIDRGNMSENHIVQMREYLDLGVKPWGLDNPNFKIIESVNSVCVIRYSVSVKFSNSFLGRVIPYPEITALIICVVIFILSIVVLNKRTVKRMKDELDKLLKATENITRQNLDFDIEVNNIIELQVITNSLERMRDALKISLHEQIESEQSKLQQISALAHDIKIPVTIIRGNAELLLLTELNPKQKEFTDDIHSSVLQIETYTRNLVEVSKHNLSGIQTKTQTSVSALLSGIESAFRAYIKNQSIEFKLQNELPSNTMVFVDSDLVHRAMMNILCNAPEHNSNVHKIVLKAVPKDHKELILQVQDDGEGFSVEALKHAAELFYTQNGARSSGGHYGIGLNFAYQAARLHGGFLTIRNNEAGGQVQFVIPYAVRNLSRSLI